MLRTSKNGRKEITRHEGEVLKVYLDPVGLPTAGVGHLLTAAEKKIYKVGQKITKAQSQEWLNNDLQRFEKCINEAVEVPINQNQFDALVSLAFNIGEKAFEGSSVLRHLNAGRYEKAADAFLLWNKGTVGKKKVVLPGLKRRREEERDLFLQPISAAAKPAPLLDQPDSAQRPTVGPPPSATSPQIPFIDRVFTPIQDVKGKFDQLGVDPATVSKSSAITTILTKVAGWPMLIFGFFSENPLYLVAGLILIVAAIWFFSRAKTHATMRATSFHQ